MFFTNSQFRRICSFSTNGCSVIVYAKNTAQKVLACVPLIFATQQFAEGVLWLSLFNEQWIRLKHISTLIFLIFAQVVWPVYIPLAMLLFEQHKIRRKIMTILIFAGLVLSALTLICLLYYPVDAEATNHHIMYRLGSALSEQWCHG